MDLKANPKTSAWYMKSLRGTGTVRAGILNPEKGNPGKCALCPEQCANHICCESEACTGTSGCFHDTIVFPF
eukprot:1161655-Pelagomonas_calceolata.AAC.4